MQIERFAFCTCERPQFHKNTPSPQKKTSAHFGNIAIESCGYTINEWPSSINSRQMKNDQEPFALFRKLNHKNMTEKKLSCLSFLS